MVLESLLGVAVAAADFRVGRGQVSSTHSGVSRRHTLPRRAVPGERARPRRHVVVAVGGSSPSAVCLLLTVSRAPGLVRLCRVAALYICAGARLRRGVSGARLSSDASPARGGARLLPPLGRTKGTVADQRTVVTGRPGGWRSTRAPATEGARSAASHPLSVDLQVLTSQIVILSLFYINPAVFCNAVWNTSSLVILSLFLYKSSRIL